jgi:hypothetical protein
MARLAATELPRGLLRCINAGISIGLGELIDIVRATVSIA